MASNFPGSVDVFKTIPNPQTTPTIQSDASNDPLSTRLQQHSDAISAVETWLVNKSYVPDITSVRLRSFNAIQNPTFSVIQRNIGSLLTNPASLSALEDRWYLFKSGTMTYTVQGLNAAFPGITIPGTSYAITPRFLRVTLTGQQSVLGAGDGFAIYQQVEGCNLRELAADVHSISVLVRSSVAGLTFGVNLQDPTSTTSLSKLATISSANVFTLIPLSSLPVFPTNSNFTIIPGSLGYFINITLAAGSSITVPANDSWQLNTGDKFGAVGQGNFFANALNSTFDIAFVQHEPGAASQLIDKPFIQNYEECLRYYAKSYDYGIKPGTASNSNGVFDFVVGATGNFIGTLRFPKTMVNVPTVNIWNWSTGAINSVNCNSSNLTVTTVTGRGNAGFDEFNITPGTLGANTEAYCHYTADSGW